MVSKIYPLCLLLLAGCSGSKGEFDKGVIGQTLSETSGLYNSYGIDTKNIFVVDHATNRLLGLNTETMGFDYEFALTKPEENHYVAMDTNEKFVIDFSLKHLQVIALDGQRYDSTLKFRGTPTSVAYNPISRTMVMQDDLSSIGILKMAQNGAIEKSWLGGPLVAEGKQIEAGDVDKSGRLILAMSDGSITVVDIDATLAQQSWQHSSFKGLNSPTWLSPDHAVDNTILVASDSQLAVVNIATQTIGDTIEIPGKSYAPLSSSFQPYKTSGSYSGDPYYYEQRQLVGFSKAGKPHAIVKANEGSDPILYFIGSDGKLKTHTLTDVGSGYYRQSYLKADGTELTVLFQTDYSTVKVFGLRLSDNLVIRNTTTEISGSAKINGDFLFVDYQTGLGRLDLHNLNDDSTKTVQGYNFDYLRNQ